MPGGNCSIFRPPISTHCGQARGSARRRISASKQRSRSTSSCTNGSRAARRKSILDTFLTRVYDLGDLPILLPMGVALLQLFLCLVAGFALWRLWRAFDGEDRF